MSPHQIPRLLDRANAVVCVTPIRILLPLLGCSGIVVVSHRVRTDPQEAAAMHQINGGILELRLRRFTPRGHETRPWRWITARIGYLSRRQEPLIADVERGVDEVQ